MGSCTRILFLCLVVLLLFSSQARADYTAKSAVDVLRIISKTEHGTDSGSMVINGQTVTWAVESPGSDYCRYWVNGKYVATDDWGLGQEEGLRVSELIYKALLSYTLASSTSPASAAAKTSGIVFNTVVMPSAQTRRAKEKATAMKALQTTRTIGGQLRYANIEHDDSDGDVIGCNVGMVHDFENFTIGGILPYDHLDLDDVFEANRLGLILFAQYFHDVTSSLNASFTGNLNYVYTDVDYDYGGEDGINTYGGGLSTSLTLDKDSYTASAGLSYQYNKEDIDTKDDYQHLIKLGANAGYRIGQNMVITIFGIWNKDITDYENDYQDVSYFDIGTETTINMSDTFAVTIGFKKVVSLDNYDSDEIYLGSMLRF